jgi:hypothetical protein
MSCRQSADSSSNLVKLHGVKLKSKGLRSDNVSYNLQLTPPPSNCSDSWSGVECDTASVVSIRFAKEPRFRAAASDGQPHQQAVESDSRSYLPSSFLRSKRSRYFFSVVSSRFFSFFSATSRLERQLQVNILRVCSAV